MMKEVTVHSCALCPFVDARKTETLGQWAYLCRHPSRDIPVELGADLGKPPPACPLRTLGGITIKIGSGS